MDDKQCNFGSVDLEVSEIAKINFHSSASVLLL